MWLIIGASVVALALVLVVVPALVHRAMGPALRQRVAKVLGPGEVVHLDPRAMSFGVESRGVLQGRGNGALVLTASALRFFRFLPSAEGLIPLGAIREVKTVRRHLGKAIGRDLLHVAFTADGKPDSMAWYVTDLEA